MINYICVLLVGDGGERRPQSIIRYYVGLERSAEVRRGN
jgi:hypothetical protein